MMTRSLVPIILLVLNLGCAMPADMNFECRWPIEPAEIVPTTAHLAHDLEVAEELAIRYGDHRGGRQPRPVFRRSRPIYLKA